MSIAMDIFRFPVHFMMLFSAVLFVVTGAGGFKWPISTRAVHTDAAFWKISNNPTNYASVADATIFIMILNFTCAVPFSTGIYFIGMLDFFPRKNIHLLCFVPLVLRCRMHPNIYGESFRFFYILLLNIYATRYNLSFFLWFAVSIIRFVCNNSREFIAINIIGLMSLE